jgi:hypothetical protein
VAVAAATVQAISHLAAAELVVIVYSQDFLYL